ncbi:Reticulon-domain-containing protein [Dactylonectria macrodidyma]|uniref:Reticulon-domain-containing protein n=1 Tax=Dactylonectria macrodidyma TaxID=307937 RepID=A0A9P9J3W9_9HYPO|nr:Reticulon-domain-containing protein [Dactylonectria macrodidyma]
MSGSAYIVMPVQADGAQHSEQDREKIASAIQQSLPKNTNSEDHEEQVVNGPLKEIIAHQDSLYKYISWEDPVRTLGSYIGALSILFGLHYLPLTRLALKAVTTILGVISVTEFASRIFGPNTFLARLRPKQYQKVPESTLNATLKDIHDFVQYSVVQVQRIVYGEDLDKTFAAFLSFTALYWLIKVLAPFGLAVLGLTSLYIAPLITSPRGREVAHDTRVRANELATAAADKGNTIARDGKAKAMELSSKAREAVDDTGRRTRGLAENGKQTATDLFTKARYPTSGAAEGTAGDVERLPEMGTNTINDGSDTVKLSLGDAE